MYKCIKSFDLPTVWENFIVLEDDFTTVPEGSLWHLPEEDDYRSIGGDIRLESDEGDWIETSKTEFEKYFVNSVARCN